MNVTLSVDDEILTKVRDIAARRRTSLNQLIRDYLEEIASDSSPAEVLGELESLWSEEPGDSGGRRWTREDIHERTDVS